MNHIDGNLIEVEKVKEICPTYKRSIRDSTKTDWGAVQHQFGASNTSLSQIVLGNNGGMKQHVIAALAKVI